MNSAMYNEQDLLDLLHPYIQDPDDPEHNYNVAIYYHEIGQTASAVSFYIRAAERTDQVLLKYECLVRASMCFDSQGCRGFSTWGMLKHAIALLPTRPEAYLMLSQLIEATGEEPGKWFDGYMLCSQALIVCDFDSPPLRTDVGFPGKYSVIFQQAHCAWWCGLCEDAKNIFVDLLENYEMSDQYKTAVKNNLERMEEMNQDKTDKFDWGTASQNEWFRNIVEQEVFHMNVYQKFVSVQPGDVVVDMGASVGPFTWKIKSSQPSKVYCFEPHLALFEDLKKNTSYDGVTHINRAIGTTDGFEVQYGLFDELTIETAAEENAKPVKSIRWDTFIESYNIEHINFLKIDCEGGEYSVFTEENMPWIKENVDYIVGEWHLTDSRLKEQFRHFRDVILPYYEPDQVQVFSFDEVNIKPDLHTEWFIEHYGTINFYIDNRKKETTSVAINTTTNELSVTPPKSTLNLEKVESTPPKAVQNYTAGREISQKESFDIIASSGKGWKHSIAPTMEITTIIPEKGCVVDCVFCPQRTLTKVYTGERRMDLQKYKAAIDKIPKEVRITFAGFVEPWMHRQCTEMVLYAHETGHPVSVFTTAVGMSIADVDAIKHIPFAGAPNGNFTLHLPDQDRKAKHPINKTYIETVEYIASIQHEIHNFTTMVMAGDVHESVRHVFPTAPSYSMWSRAGNLIGETILKPELLNNKFNSVYHENKKMTCGCDERLYHNILLPNGDVSLCCMDYGLVEITGNLFEQDYESSIPTPYAQYDLCNYCENAVPYDHAVIENEMRGIAHSIMQNV